jgi:hypothetical protein
MKFRTALLASCLAVLPTVASAQTPAQSKSFNTLLQAYGGYIVSKYCHDTRNGYLLQWVNDAEIDKARAYVKHLEDEAQKAFDGQLDTDKLYREARRYVQGYPVNGSNCHVAYRQLMSSPDAEGRTGYTPLTEKDF